MHTYPELSSPFSSAQQIPTCPFVSKAMTIDTNGRKRKRSPQTQYLSSPPPDSHKLGYKTCTQVLEEELYPQEEEATTKKEQGAQTDIQLPVTASLAWNGRGRSPYKTPTTAALDSLKHKTLQLEALDREIKAQEIQVQQSIASKRQRLALVTQHNHDVCIMGPNVLDSAPRLRQPEGSRGRSSSPTRYLDKLAQGAPPILLYSFETIENDPPKLVDDAVTFFETGLGEKCIPSKYRVCPHLAALFCVSVLQIHYMRFINPRCFTLQAGKFYHVRPLHDHLAHELLTAPSSRAQSRHRKSGSQNTLLMICHLAPMPPSSSSSRRPRELW